MCNYFLRVDFDLDGVYLSLVMSGGRWGEDREVIFTGDGCPVYKDVLDRMLSGRAHSYAPFTQSRQRAGSVALAAFSYFEKGLTVSADDSHPEYLRLSQAERELMEKKKADGEG